MNKKHKLLAFTFLFAFIQLSTLLIPLKATAATEYTPEQIGKAWQVGMGLGNCADNNSFVDGGFYADRNVDALNAGLIFRHNEKKVVGRLTEPDDGEIKCDNGDEIRLLLSAIGENPVEFLREAGIYKLDVNVYKFQPSNNGDARNKIREAIEKKFGFSYSNGLGDATKYALLLAPFKGQCLGSPPVKDSNGVEVSLVNNKGEVAKEGYAFKIEGNRTVEVGYSVAATQELDCTTIAKELNKYADAYAARIKDLNTAGVDTSDTGFNSTNSDAGAPSCETSGFSLSWLICPLITGISETSDAIFNDIIQPLLVARDIGYTDMTSGNNSLFMIWSSFRVIANVLLVIGLLVIVFGQSLGGGVIDAYTAKKALPRVLIAAILINISIYVVMFALDLGNIAGQGISSLLLAPFRDTGNDLVQLGAGGSAMVTVSLGVGIVALLGAGGGIGGALLLFLFAIIIVVLAFLAVLITLVIRQGIIILLVLASPLAFAMYILPNTEQYFKKWWNLLLKTLLVYPIVMAMLGVSYMLSIVLTGSGGGGIFPAGVQWVASLVSVLLMVIPLFLVPFAFKLSGGAIGSLFNMLNNNPLSNLTKRAAKNQTGKGFADSGHKIKNGEVFRGRTTGLRGRVNQGAAVVGHLNKAGIRPSQWASNVGTAISTSEMQEINNMMEDAEYAPIKGDDNLNAAMFEWAHSGSVNGADLRAILERMNYANGDEATIARAISYAGRVRRKMSRAAFEQMAVIQTQAGGTVWTDSEAWEAAGLASHGDQAALANMVVKGRSGSMGAGRTDVGAGSFGTTFGYAQQLSQLRAQLDSEAITEDEYNTQQAALSLGFQGSILESQGPGTILHPSIKPRAVEAQISAMRQRIAEAVSGGNQDEIDRELAIAQSLHDELSRTAPNKARIVADQLLRWDPTSPIEQNVPAPGVAGPVMGDGPTVQELANARRGRPMWQTTHKEFSDQFERQTTAAARAAEAEALGRVGGGPINPLGGAPPGGGLG